MADAGAGFCHRFVLAQVDLLVLERFHEALGLRIVVGIQLVSATLQPQPSAEVGSVVRFMSSIARNSCGLHPINETGS